MFTKFDKALAALLVSSIVPLVTYFTGWEISVEIQAVLVTALTTLFVWLTPNKPAE